MDVKIEASWKEELRSEFKKDYFKQIVNHIKTEKKQGVTIYPAGTQIFQAFNSTPLKDVKVVILGQDPYHGPNQAHGLSFSVQKGVPPPPSLVNIFKELQEDTGMPAPKHGCLEKWAEQGVFLLNASLTVRAHDPLSHSKIGWTNFTDAVIKKVAESKQHVVFMLWGKYAQQKKELIPAAKHLILTAAHPSPLSAKNGFFGCRHFSRANQYLMRYGIHPIDWAI
jgi:uracil-DNA glycosylase